VFKTILVTTDFSDLAGQAVAPALAVAEKFGSKILVLYVVEDRLPPFVDEYTGISLEEIVKGHTERAKGEMTRFVERYFAGRANVEEVLVHGIPASEIARVAQERRADLIVMATHGHGFVSHVLFGSTTERVLRHAPCPVLTVRATGDRDDKDR
jgi:nucleotide-binding universal stress UspA family protein